MQTFKRLGVGGHSAAIMPIDHVGRVGEHLYYVMPLADGDEGLALDSPAWVPLTLTLGLLLQRQKSAPQWFSSAQIIAWLHPVTLAIATVNRAGLIHRDVKPDNILFLRGQPVLSDISLLREDAPVVTEIGTPGYRPPSYYTDTGGQPDMWGLAATLYATLTGNSPDKMGRPAYQWPPQGKDSLFAAEHKEWLRLHRVIFQATDESSSERYRTFEAFAEALLDRALPIHPPSLSHKHSEQQTPSDLTDKERADYTAMASLAALYFTDKEYQSALDMVNRLFKTYSVFREFPFYSTMRARSLFHLGRHAEALTELRRGLIDKTLDLGSFGKRIELWTVLGDLNGAEAETTRVIEEDQAVTLHYIIRAKLRLVCGDFAGADADILAAGQLDDDPDRANLVENYRRDYAKDFPEYGKYLEDRVFSSEGTSTR